MEYLNKISFNYPAPHIKNFREEKFCTDKNSKDYLSYTRQGYQRQMVIVWFQNFGFYESTIEQTNQGFSKKVMIEEKIKDFNGQIYFLKSLNQKMKEKIIFSFEHQVIKLGQTIKQSIDLILDTQIDTNIIGRNIYNVFGHDSVLSNDCNLFEQRIQKQFLLQSIIYLIGDQYKMKYVFKNQRIQSRLSDLMTGRVNVQFEIDFQIKFRQTEISDPSVLLSLKKHQKFMSNTQDIIPEEAILVKSENRFSIMKKRRRQKQENRG
ncbi:unnamed protein product [Paramecium pentaurelia]|uniref:Uncharacterized protein n=1 Tax=Paramecium pentaurelia TaxID=43138 RepID=A0A8S1X1R2_9CILI|nr:unnamed protein product [Paramecium pentaurelia]